MQSEPSSYNDPTSFECLPCAEGCDVCEDASPCVAELNWPMRTSILILACAVIGFLPPAAAFTFRYQQVKVSVVKFPLEGVFLALFCVHFLKWRTKKVPTSHGVRNEKKKTTKVLN